ncbi:MAG: type II secretion system F family protein [Pseudomonadota bacterium]
MSHSAPREDHVFRYDAANQGGEKKKGLVSAKDALEARQKLRAQGLLPIEVIAVKTSQAPRKGLRKAPKETLSQREQADAISRLAKLTDSQVKIDRALQIMSRAQEGAVPFAAQRLRVSLREGGNLIDGLRDCFGLTDTVSLSLIKSASVGGELPQALSTVADILTKRLMLKRRIITSLLYPSLLLVVAILSIGLVMIAIIPQFKPLVEDKMEMLPFLGRSIFFLSGLITALWPYALGAMLCATAFGWIEHRRGRLAPAMGKLVRAIPAIATIVNTNQIIVMLNVLGALIRRGIVLSDALKALESTTPSGPAKASLSVVSQNVRGGSPLSAALEDARLMPSSAIEMVRIGEETGDLASMLQRASDELREESDRTLERFMALFQPILIVIVGSIIGVCLYALFSAITTVNSIAF